MTTQTLWIETSCSPKLQLDSLDDTIPTGRFRKSRHRPNQFSWTKLIAEHTKRGQGRYAITIYKRMREEGVIASTYTFVAALKASATLIDLQCGKEIHAHVIESGNQSDIFVATTLVDTYVKCGSMHDACHVFEQMRHRDVVSWNAMIMGYAQLEKGNLAVELYARMQREGFTPDDRTFVAVLKACGSLATHEEAKEVAGERVKIRCLEQGRAIHREVARSGFESNAFVANTLVDMYAKCGSMVDARQAFEKMMHRDVVSWTAMIVGYTQMGMGNLALQLYARMQHEGLTPNDRTFVAALKACSAMAAQEEAKEVDGKLIKRGCLEKGRAIHSQLAKGGFESDVFVANTLMNLYAKCGSMVDACQVFENIMHRNVVSWTAIISGYARMEMGDSALRLYAQMQHEGFMPSDRTFAAALKACSSLATHEEAQEGDGELIKLRCLEKGKAIHSQVAKSGFESDLFVATSLIVMYVKCGSMVDARRVFDKMGHHDVASWTAIIMGYAQAEKGESALQLYACMKHEGLVPDAYTFVAVLKACGSLACLKAGKIIHAEICKVGLEGDRFIATCLLDMYGKCGSMVDAQSLFNAFPWRNVVTWSTLIAGYSSQGDCDCVLNLLERMQWENIQPDDITFVFILSVCSRSGLVDKGQKYFQAMCSDYGIIPRSEHYTCMADLFGRSGQLDEAVAMVKRMQLQPDIVTWTTILDACQKWNNVEIGRHAFECVLRLDGKCASAYVLMMNI